MHPMAPRALDGLRIVECGVNGAASYAAKLMADLGADIVKVEPPDGDPQRALGPFPGGKPDPEKSGAFLYRNCNKLGVTIDLSDTLGQSVLARLLEDADALIHDYTPIEAERRGLVYDVIGPDNPKLVMTSITPFGQDGPYRDYNSYDLTTLSAGGWAWINGWPNHPHLPPLRAFGNQTEFQAGVNGALATMGALFGRLRTGKGQHIDISAQECITSILEMTYVFWPYASTPAVRWGQRPLQPVDFFQCKDDGWIFALCIEEHQWESLVELMDTPEWTTWEVAANRFVRASNWDALRPFMEEWVAQWTLDDLYKAAQEKRIPFAPASTMSDLLDSQHLKARGFFVEVAHPAAGKLTQPGAPYKLSATPWEIRAPAPALGQHNDAVLGERLGLDLAALKEAGVV
jgi:crotonobetainyl-CoA:carnitine CoA-transferase CaiB-like acyl-CoA transferase